MALELSGGAHFYVLPSPPAPPVITYDFTVWAYSGVTVILRPYYKTKLVALVAVN